MPPKTNKLNIYLIKQAVTKFDDILKDDPGQTRHEIKLSNNAKVYYKKSEVVEPEWLETFFGASITKAQRKNFKTSGVQALLVTSVSDKKGERIFALPFGYGRFMIKEATIEERFGLITVLNSLQEQSIRNIEKRTLAKNSKLTREQIARAGSAADFDIDVENDIIEAITGRL